MAAIRIQLEARSIGRKPPIKWFNCKQEGQLPRSAEYIWGFKITGDAVVEGQQVDEIVLDTGCKRTMVHQKQVAPDSLIEGDVATIKCAHGDTALYPLAKVKMENDGIPTEVEAAVSGTLLVPVLLGGDMLQLKQLISSSTGPNSL